MPPGVQLSRVLQGSFRAGARPFAHSVAQASGRQTIPVPSQVMSLSRGGGQTLPTAVRQQMESALGATFAAVRVHH